MKTPRATLAELKEFANKVREAGGGNPLDALMPAAPSDSQQCLIAKNLNFNCEVDNSGETTEWSMTVDDHQAGRDIASKLDLNYTEDEYAVYIDLPDEIGNVAATFDAVDTAFNLAGLYNKTLADALADEGLTVDDVNEFLPYIEEATKEAYSLASYINEDGSIVL